VSRTTNPTALAVRAARSRSEGWATSPAATGSARIACSSENAAPSVARAAHPWRPRQYKRSATRPRTMPSGTCSAAGHSAASVPRGCRSQSAAPTSAHGAGMSRSRKRLRTSSATARVSSSGTAMATPNGNALQTPVVSRISRNRAGRTMPRRSQEAIKKPPTPISSGARQLLKSSARGAPRQTTGTPSATTAAAVAPNSARPAWFAAACSAGTPCVIDAAARGATRLCTAGDWGEPLFPLSLARPPLADGVRPDRRALASESRFK
jgi:hypothetical protein